MDSQNLAASLTSPSVLNSGMAPAATAPSFGRWTVGNGVITIGTSARMAGAIDSLIFNGKEFINADDHGRELQVAYTNFSQGECNNPTEAGSADDGAKNTSTTQLLGIQAVGANLQTTQNLAFWLKPGERSPGCPSSVTHPNSQTVSTDQQFSKNVQIGYNGDPQIITFDLAVNNTNPVTGFTIEAPTAYLGADFSSNYMYIPSEDRLQGIDMGAWQTIQSGASSYYGGEQIYPAIISTPDGQHAMGVISANQNGVAPRYALYEFPVGAGSTNKWSIVFRHNQLAAAPLRIRSFIVVGNVQQVQQRLAALSQALDMSASAIGYDRQIYAAANADLAGMSLMQLGNHWLSNGIGEGRRGSAFFDGAYYNAAHADLQAAFGGDLSALHSHYIIAGVHEGRRASLEFDPVFYLDNNPDLKAAFGSDFYAAANHWMFHGISEGRDGSADFSPSAYLARYADLQQAFGPNDYYQALVHWIAHGRAEGRIGSRSGGSPPVSRTVTSTTVAVAAPSPAVVASIAPFVPAALSAVTKVPVYRFFKALTGEHLYTSNAGEGTGAGYALDGMAFYIIGEAVADSRPLYRCFQFIIGKHFTSTDSGCEGTAATNEGSYGNIYGTQAEGGVPLYRFSGILGDHLSTTNPAEAYAAGYSLDAILGYVPQ